MAAIESLPRKIFGLPLERALDYVSTINVVALWVVALGGAVIAVTTFLIIRWQDEIQRNRDAAFETYKLGVATQVADAKKEGIEAGKTAGNALVRAAELEKDAAEARLETERIKTAVSWRTISPATAADLEKVLARKRGAVNLRYMDGDPEALFLAIQLLHILGRAHWQIGPGAFKPQNTIVFGIFIPDAAGDDVHTLRKAFSAAEIPYSTDPLTTAGAGFGIVQIPGAPTLMVGSRQPALP